MRTSLSPPSIWPEEVEVTDEVLSELGTSKATLKRIRRKQRRRFLKGPLPLDWIIRTNIGANTTVLAQIVKLLIDTTGGEPVHIPPEIWQQLGLSRNTRKRALNALERAGIIRAERSPGQSTRVWLIDKPGGRDA